MPALDLELDQAASSNPRYNSVDLEPYDAARVPGPERPTLESSLAVRSYEVLPTQTSFRLLNLEARLSSDPQAELACSLHTYDLEDAPSFKALSYTWGLPYRDAFTREIDGNSNSARFISCNASPFAITENLFAALWALREAKITGWLWVDALCINQDDIKERESQVLLMGRIYSSATEVIVWLGPLRFGLDDLVWATTEFLTALSTAGHRLEASGESPSDLYQAGNLGDPSFHRILGIENPVPRLIRLAQFCASCRWFSRAWVIQEFLLARHARAFSGHIELSLSRLGELAWILRVTGWGPLISQAISKLTNRKAFAWLEEPLRWHVVMVSTKLRIERLIHSGTANEEAAFEWFSSTLALSRIAECKDKRDHIYSILGIADLYFTNKRIAYYLTPSYTISLEDLLTLVAIKLFEHSRYIDSILSDVGACSEDARPLELPSWVPDYCSAQSNAQPLLGIGDGNTFDAALCLSTSRSERSLSMTTLTCPAASFDTIQQVYIFESAQTSGVRSSLQFCLSLPQQASGRRRLEVLWRTLIADITSEGLHPAPPSIERGFLAHTKVLFAQWVLESVNSGHGIDPGEAFEELCSILAELGFSDAPDEQLTAKEMRDHYDLLKLAQSLEGEERKAVEREINKAIGLAFAYSHAEGRFSQGRELFITERGFLGCGPNTIRKSDQVWLLNDSRLPFILRPCGETSNFTLVGECYVHDFMHGEMLDDCWGLKNRIRSINII